MDDRARTALIALRKIVRATEMNSKKVVRDAGLTPSQLLVLQMLARESRLTAGDIAKAATLSQATVSTLVDKLEARALVGRRRSDVDRRVVWVEITPAGQRLSESAPNLLQDRFEAQFGGLAQWEQAFIVAALERVALMLDAAEMDAAPILDVGAIDRTPG